MSHDTYRVHRIVQLTFDFLRSHLGRFLPYLSCSSSPIGNSLLSSLSSLSMSNVPPSCSASPPGQTEDAIRAQAEECQKIVDDTLSESISGPAFLRHLKEAGATPDEARDYIEQYTQRRGDQEATGSANAGLPSGQPDPSVPNPADIATSITWALLRAKVNHFQGASSQTATTSGGSLSDELANLLRLSSVKGAIPSLPCYFSFFLFFLFSFFFS
jgi:hypothetical protein